MSEINFTLNPGAWGYALAALCYLILVLLLLTSWRGRIQGGLLLAVCLLSAVWAATLSYSLSNDFPLSIVHIMLELLRNGAVLLFLYKVLAIDREQSDLVDARFRGLGYAIIVVWLVLLLLHLTAWLAGQSLLALLGYDPRLVGHLVLALTGLVLIEQLFRNTPPQQRWAIKYLCLGLGSLFAYDFYLYSNAVLFQSLDPQLWDARGFIHLLVVPLIAVSAARNPQWSLEIFVSRRAVFHSAAVLGAGFYLLLMALGGYAIRYFGGNWGSLAQVTFLFGSGLLLFALMFSGQMRARMRVFLSKHFFNYKYDYRDEWLKFIGALANEEPGPGLGEHVLQAMAEIVDSPGGVLWVYDNDTARFELSVESNATGVSMIAADDPFVVYLQQKEWLFDLNEFNDTPEIYEGLVLPEWLAAIERAWLVIPLFQNKRLTGLMLLLQPRAVRQINWEDRDLLKTVATQAASYLALSQASTELANARQFEAFNRLSAYVVHDLKNVIGQLSLVVANSKKFGHRQEFVDDAFATVENSVNKMQKMLAQLRQGRASQQSSTAIKLQPIIDAVIRQCSEKRPVPMLANADVNLSVLAEQDRLAAVIEHVLQNAQEATSADGEVILKLTSNGQNAVIEIRDSGTGMDEQFIRERLFRPFDTTKGNAGMGIGAYECREFVRELGGEVRVKSKLGVGTVFQLYIPTVSG